MKELEKENYDAYRIIIEVVRYAARLLYFASPATNALGLEACMEAIMDMIDQGLAKVVYNDEEDVLYVGYFNSATGKYQPPAFMCEKEDDIF